MGALGLGLAGCGQTEQENPLLHPPPDVAGSAGGLAPAAGGAGSDGAGLGGTGPSASGASGSAGSSGSGSSGASGASPIEPSAPLDTPPTTVARSNGCGKPYEGQPRTKITIQTSGVKAPDCADKRQNGTPVCGAWSVARDYYVNLPINYDPTKAYSLMFEAPGCGGNGTNLYQLSSSDNSEVIRVGLSPGPNSTGHGTNPEQGCFDDKEGDDSIDWVFYENVYDKLNAELCFDRNRVFAGGNSSGAWFANELGCKYAGDPVRPVRGVLPNMGGLPTEPRYVPTCSKAPLAGIWIHEVTSQTTPFSSAKVAIQRAMSVAPCEGGASYDNATFKSFPIGGNNADDACKLIVGCNPLYPLVVCAMPGVGRGVGDNVVVPGWSTFLKLFVTPPLLTP